MPVAKKQSDDHLILIVADDDEGAKHLKELLEFMDAPMVQTAKLGNWQSNLGERRLSAVFLGPCLDETASEKLIGEIGEFDPNVSIVIVDAQEEPCWQG